MTTSPMTPPEDKETGLNSLQLAPETKRVAVLIGTVTFQDLFTLPWSKLSQQMMTNAVAANAQIAAASAAAAQPGTEEVTLDSDVIAVDTTAITEIDPVYGSITLLEMFRKEAERQLAESDQLPQVWPRILSTLGFPPPKSDDGLKAILMAMDDLATDAGSCTFESIYEETTVDGDEDKTARARMALLEARENDLLHMPQNGLCCSCTPGPCHCAPAAPTAFCSLGADGLCVLGSTSCAGPVG